MVMELLESVLGVSRDTLSFFPSGSFSFGNRNSLRLARVGE